LLDGRFVTKRRGIIREEGMYYMERGGEKGTCAIVAEKETKTKKIIFKPKVPWHPRGGHRNLECANKKS